MFIEYALDQKIEAHPLSGSNRQAVNRADDRNIAPFQLLRQFLGKKMQCNQRRPRKSDHCADPASSSAFNRMP